LLKITDFFHLPKLVQWMDEVVAEESGLILVVGLDPRPHARSIETDSFLPSGRSTIFRILMRQLIDKQDGSQSILVTRSKDALRVSRQQKRRVKWLLYKDGEDCVQCIDQALGLKPPLLVVEQMCEETILPILEVSRRGIKVLTQMDTIFLGSDVARSLIEMGASYDLLEGLKWILAVQRLPMLCSHCRESVDLNEIQRVEVQQRFPDFLDQRGATFYQAKGCQDCQHTGRHGDVTAFDLFHANWEAGSLFDQASVLSLSEYALTLASMGYVDLKEALRIDSNQLRRTYHLLDASESALNETNIALQGKLYELEAANKVLQQRTEALFSLQEVNQALVSAMHMKDLAHRVCRYTLDLCGADRAILYYLRPDETAEVLAAHGWDLWQVVDKLEAEFIHDCEEASGEPKPYPQFPPGIMQEHGEVEVGKLRAGLQVPLLAHGKPVGMMIVHSTSKLEFRPGEVALMQSFANQAALAIQRAGLIEQLQEKISELEAAQVELIKKERMEKELELARRVQQSVLPKSFPDFPGYQLAAQNKPAREVSGDLYDVIQLDHNHLGVMVADVSGKGMPAALYMALTRSLFRAEAKRGASPMATLKNINQLLLELGDPDMFVSVFYGVIQVETGQFIYSCAGHNRPFLVREGNVQELESHGMILGFFQQDDLNLSEEEIELAPGDRIVLYTDGLTDILSPAGVPLNRSFLMDLLSSSAIHSPEEICSRVFSELISFQGDMAQYDDMTMLVIGVEPS
jgi:serine phosphatase RsbU (regulator of sigma subunit)